MRKAVMALMANVSTMTLATSRQNTPRATDVYFANDNFDLVFFSSPNSEHSRNLAVNRNCSATIHPVVSEWRENKGIRVDGIALPVDDSSLKIRAVSAYLKKFPFASQLLNTTSEPVQSENSVELYVLRVSELTYIDNALGFGTKYFTPIINGVAEGAPQKI